jgi:hypothetical protein
LRKDRSRELKDAKDAHEEQRDDIQEQLAERLDEESENLKERRQEAQEAHDQQLADAREADRQRLEDMAADFALRKAREDEDRALRLARLAEDHQLQLDEMARAHADEMARIATEAAEELAKRNEAFEIEMNELGKHFSARKKAEDEFQRNSLETFRNYLSALESEYARRLASIHPSGADPYADRDNSFANPNFNVPYNPVPGWRANSGMSSNTTRNVTIGDIHIDADGLSRGEARTLIVEVVTDILEDQ